MPRPSDRATDGAVGLWDEGRDFAEVLTTVPFILHAPQRNVLVLMQNHERERLHTSVRSPAVIWWTYGEHWPIFPYDGLSPVAIVAVANHTIPFVMVSRLAMSDEVGAKETFAVRQSNG